MKQLIRKTMIAFSFIMAITASFNVTADGKLQVFSGVYATQLFDIDFQQEQFEIQFWAWFVHDTEAYKPWERTEVTNAKSFKILANTRELIDGQYFDSIKVQAVIRGTWDLTYFPFDHQTLNIELEDNQQTNNSLQFVVDERHSGLNGEVLPHGWHMSKQQISSHPHQYSTTFGDPRLTATNLPQFSQIKVAYSLKRAGNRLFVTLFLGFALAWFLTTLVIVANCSRKISGVIAMSDLVSISIGALFTTVASIYTLSDALPYTTRMVLADHIQIITLMNILLAIMTTIWARMNLFGGDMSIADTDKTCKLRYRSNLIIALGWQVFCIGYFIKFFLY
jgi:hypothetical protein